MIILIGNVIALLAAILMVYSGYLKEKKKILYIQSIEVCLASISNVILGGFTGAIISLFSFIRNVLCYKDKLGIKEKVIITVLMTIISVMYNNLGFIGYLPLISSIIYLWLMNIKDVIKFKYLIVFTMILWIVYDFKIKSYSMFIFDIFTILSNCISILQIKYNKKIY